MHKFVITLLVLLFIPNSYSQTLDLFGKLIVFGSSDMELSGTFWQDEGQIESEYPYIKVYENDSADGAFYENCLAALYVKAYNNEPYPICQDIEDLLLNVEPYGEYVEFNGIGIFIQLYKTGDFYISRAGSRMHTNYIIIPIEILDEIHKTHPEYLHQFFN